MLESVERSGGVVHVTMQLLVVQFRLPWIGILFYIVQSTKVYVEHGFLGVDCKALQVGIGYAFEEYIFCLTLLYRADELNR